MENGKAFLSVTWNTLFLQFCVPNVEMPVANREKPPTPWREEGILGTDSSHTDEVSLLMNLKFVISMLFV